MKHSALLLILTSILVPCSFSCNSGLSGDANNTEIQKEARPWAYWWWMGSSVNPVDITTNLETYSRGGFGGLHIIPIYGEKGDEFLPAVPGTAGNKFRVEIGDNILNAEIQNTGNSNAPKPVKVGTVKIDKPGTYKFILKPVDDGKWTEFRFQGVEMKWME